jgi:hypothetical protein
MRRRIGPLLVPEPTGELRIELIGTINT